MNRIFVSLGAVGAAVALVLSTTTTALGFARFHRLYAIEGYLDRAPDGVTIIDRVDIAAIGTPRRQLLVTSYRNPAEAALDHHFSREIQAPYLLRGDRQSIARLVAAPEGAPVKGTFALYRHGVPFLLIADLAQPD